MILITTNFYVKRKKNNIISNIVNIADILIKKDDTNQHNRVNSMRNRKKEKIY